MSHSVASESLDLVIAVLCGTPSVLSIPPCINAAGEKQGHSLLARDAPSLWYEAAESLAPLPAASTAAAAITEQEFEAKKQTAIAALQNEEAVFERDLGQPQMMPSHAIYYPCAMHHYSCTQLRSRTIAVYVLPVSK